MSVEIERKFLVNDPSWKEGLTEADSSFIQQAYLSLYPEPTVRVRIKDSHAWLTVKSKPDGIKRAEYEYKIPHKDAVEMMKLAVSGNILKRRYNIRYKGKNWELDEFYDENEGLVLAELELKKADEPFEKPGWLGEEVSMDPKYSNSSLASKPFTSWK